MSDTFCPECGWDVSVDEDGLCTGCGATAIGVGVRKLVLERNTLRRELEEARALTDTKTNEAFGFLQRALEAEEKLAAAEKGQTYWRDRAGPAEYKFAAVSLENARLREAAGRCVPEKGVGISFETLLSRIDDLRAALVSSSPDEMVERARKYMSHDKYCDKMFGRPTGCTCGLDTLLREIGGKA